MQVSQRVISPLVMVVSGLSLYAGAAVAVSLFEVFPPIVVAHLRMSAAAAIMLVFSRPKVAAFLGEKGRKAALYGLATMAMNMAFYQAIDGISLGIAVAIEFLGPIVVAAWGSTMLRDWVALVLAIAGVVVISGATWSDNAVGIIWALIAGAMWAGYIVAGSAIASAEQAPRQSMAVGFSYAALLGVPVAWWLWPDTGVDMSGINIFALVMAMGLLSAALPYSLDQVVLRLAGASYFALVQAILPVVSAIVGAVALGQMLSTAEMIGIGLIVVAVALRKP